jgi:hypothetical protein
MMHSEKPLFTLPFVVVVVVVVVVGVAIVLM